MNETTPLPGALQQNYDLLTGTIGMAKRPELAQFVSDLNDVLNGKVDWVVYELAWAAQRAAITQQEILAGAEAKPLLLSSSSPTTALMNAFESLAASVQSIAGIELEKALLAVPNPAPDDSVAEMQLRLGLAKALVARRCAQDGTEYTPEALQQAGGPDRTATLCADLRSAGQTLRTLTAR